MYIIIYYYFIYILYILYIFVLLTYFFTSNFFSRLPIQLTYIMCVCGYVPVNVGPCALLLAMINILPSQH